MKFLCYYKHHNQQKFIEEKNVGNAVVARFYAWWLRNKKPLEIIGVTLFLVGLFALVVFIILGYIYNWAWVGIGPKAPSFQHGKTLWDWLQLLIIPAVLAIGGYAFNLTVSRNERNAVTNRDQTERDIALDNQREAALQEYIDKMSELLLDKKLRDSAEDDEVRKIARVRTLMVLHRLDKERKKSVLQFLYEPGLLKIDKPIVGLTGADLSAATLSSVYLRAADLNKTNLYEADLRGTYLYKADLSEANLRGADLSNAYLSEANLHNADICGANLCYARLFGTNLCGANLHRADLSDANLSEAILDGANLSKAKIISEQLDRVKSLKGATMPDGSIHP